MPSEADYRSQAEALLRLAAATDNMRDRGDLIDEATRWNALAADARARDETGPARRPPEPSSFAPPHREGGPDSRLMADETPARRRRSPLRWFLGLS